MKNARKVAYDALFGACIMNAIEMHLHDVIMHNKKIQWDAPPTT